MNPYTRHLLSQSNRPDLEGLVEAWDGLEALVIEVFREGSAGPAREVEYRRLQADLRRELPRWSTQLVPHWQAATVGGEPAARDPFEDILGRHSAADFVGDWSAMQALPAARQALNMLLVQSSAGS